VAINFGATAGRYDRRGKGQRRPPQDSLSWPRAAGLEPPGRPLARATRWEKMLSVLYYVQILCYTSYHHIYRAGRALYT
jgi:hypothetical protein